MDARQAVIHAFERISSQDPAQVAAAEEDLNNWESQQNFHATLFDVFADRSLPTQVRWQAVIKLKNGINKYWRKTPVRPIQLSEKQLIRPRLLSFFDEEVPQIAIQYCVTLSRISRWDYPRVWPEFADELLSHVRQIASEPKSRVRHIKEQNVLYTLHLFIKTLCARTLMKEREALRQLTPGVVALVASIYAQRISEFTNALQSGDAEESTAILKEIRLCIKILRRLFVRGYEKPAETDRTAIDFYLASLTHLAAFYDLLKGLPAEKRESDETLILRKIILLYGKLYLDFQKSHAVAFITMNGVKDILCWYWTQVVSEAPKLAINANDLYAEPDVVLEKVLVQGLILHNEVVKNFFYDYEEDGPEDKDAKRCRQIIDGEILAPEVVQQMAQTLMAYYLPLKSRDLLEWQDDPETWTNDEQSDHWEFDIRRCAEHLFVNLVSQNKSLLIEPLVQALRAIETEQITLSNLVRCEGLYAALGLCAKDLYEAFDFCDWLEHRQSLDSPLGMIKWRVAWLVGKWIDVKFPEERRNIAYAALLGLTGRSEPLVVRMAATSSLALCVDDWDFNPAGFAPFLDQTIVQITEVLSDVTMPESRMRLVNLLGIIVSRMQRQIVPFAEAIVRLLPPLWQSAAGENLYQTSILDLITKLVDALGPQSAALHDLIVPLVKHSINLSDPAHIYLIEDGIYLWLALVRNAQELVANGTLLSLLPHAAGLLHQETEILKHVLKVIEGYFLLDGPTSFHTSGLAILEGLKELVSDTGINDRAVASGYYALNVIVQCVPVELSGKALVDSGLFWDAFSQVVDQKKVALMLVYPACFLSRLAVHYPTFFGEFLATQDAVLLGQFTENWVKLYDDIGQVPQRRLHVLAMGVSIITTNDGVLKHLPMMVPLWNEVMSDTGSSMYFGDVDDDMPDDYYGGNGESIVPANERSRRLRANDPVHRLNLKTALKQSLAECERINGSERFAQVISLVEAAELEDLKNQLDM